jgi:hypothetical protein
MDPFKTLILGTPPSRTFTGDATGLLTAANNLSDVADGATALTNLGAAPATFVTETTGALAAKSARPYVQSDGATTNRASGIFVPGARGNLAGFPGPVTWAGYVPVPTSNPSANIYINASSDANNTTPPTRNYAFSSMITSAGVFRVDQQGAVAGSDFRRLEYPGFRAAYSGRRVLIEIAWPEGDSTTDPTVYADGEDITSEFALTTGGTPPNWLDANLVGTFHMTGFNWPAGRAPLGAFGFGAFTAAERAEFVRTGLPPGWWMRGGSAVDLHGVGNALSFGADDADSGGLTQSFQATLSRESGARTGGAGSWYNRITATNTFPSGRLAITAGRVGDRVFVRFWARRNGAHNRVQAALGNSATGADQSNLLTFTLTNDWQMFEGSLTANGVYNQIKLGRLGGGGTDPGVGDYTDIDDVQIKLLGAITHPAPIRDTLIVADATDIGNVPGRIVGGNVVSADAPQTVPLSLDFNYTGSSINLLGGVILPAGTIWEVVSITGESNASVNLSLGTSTGGTQIVNAFGVTAAPFRIGTFASQLINATAATGLWLTGSGNVAGRINVQLRKVK